MVKLDFPHRCLSRNWSGNLGHLASSRNFLSADVLNTNNSGSPHLGAISAQGSRQERKLDERHGFLRRNALSGKRSFLGEGMSAPIYVVALFLGLILGHAFLDDDRIVFLLSPSVLSCDFLVFARFRCRGDSIF